MDEGLSCIPDPGPADGPGRQAADAGKPLTLRVIEAEPAGKDTRRFRLVSAGGQRLPPAGAGSHINLLLPGGIIRSYSLLRGEPAPIEYAIAVRRETPGRGGSAFLHDQLSTGDQIEALPPQNGFPLVETAPHSVLIGGGIGVTPLIAMASRLRELGRPLTFHAAFRDEDHILLADELHSIGRVTIHLDSRDGGPFPIAAAIGSAPADAHLYCCGPAAMIDAFIASAREQGRHESVLHHEYFAGARAALQEGSIIVELARTGRTIIVPPGKSILEAVREAGVPASSSCEQGTCGACETKVLAGVPDHFDAVLSPADRKSGKTMMICCSGALTERLVLDL